MKKPNPGVIIAIQTTVIAVLITAILAFVGGMKYANHTNAQVESKAKNLATIQSKQ